MERQERELNDLHQDKNEGSTEDASESKEGEKAVKVKEIFQWGMKGVPISIFRSFSNVLMTALNSNLLNLFQILQALIYTFYADRVGLSLGDCSYLEVFKYLPLFHPYKSPSELPSWQHFIDQCYMVTHIVFTNNNWGELQLPPALYTHELLFIRYYFLLFVRQKDTHLLSEFIECLRAFGCDDKDELIRLGMRCLLSLQTPEGLWDAGEDEDEEEVDAYRTYHATMCSSQVHITNANHCLVVIKLL